MVVPVGFVGQGFIDDIVEVFVVLGGWLNGQLTDQFAVLVLKSYTEDDMAANIV